MEVLVVLAVLAAVASWAAHPLRRRVRERRAVLGLDPDDIAELNAMARRVLLEYLESNTVLLHRTTMLQVRRVPLRRIDPTPFSKHWSLGFADGTSVLIRALDPATVLAMRLELPSATLALQRVSPSESGLELEFGGGRVPHRVLAFCGA